MILYDCVQRIKNISDEEEFFWRYLYFFSFCAFFQQSCKICSSTLWVSTHFPMRYLENSLSSRQRSVRSHVYHSDTCDDATVRKCQCRLWIHASPASTATLASYTQPTSATIDLFSSPAWSWPRHDSPRPNIRHVNRRTGTRPTSRALGRFHSRCTTFLQVEWYYKKIGVDFS